MLGVKGVGVSCSVRKGCFDVNSSLNDSTFDSWRQFDSGCQHKVYEVIEPMFDQPHCQPCWESVKCLSFFGPTLRKHE